ncbi:hypothetical protein [Dongia deserti]|uniref:hypothetical protein n=1 Tax=Dongia deserti TaxID=2268030 RepID=UPI0013C4CE2D|nr:hypothetical protein [Dongia deserti]
MTNRWKLWLGASALAMASGALPAAQILSPVTAGMFGLDLTNEASAQESGEGEEGTATECTTESGEGEEGGATDCAPSGEEGEGEGG